MLGAIIGDIIGSPYEFDNTFDPHFPLFGPSSDFTDDTICTIAIADSIVRGVDFGSSLRAWCRRYPPSKGRYGSSFERWIWSEHPQPYHSYGNGSAMRVSPVGWAYDSEAATLRGALASAAPTHNHVEGMIGATAVAVAIYRLRTGRATIIGEDMVVPYYGAGWRDHLPERGSFDVTCQGCVPLAFGLCMDATSYEDAVRSAVTYGGDSDTLAAIVGALAEARWGIPRKLREQALTYLPADMVEVLRQFAELYGYSY